MTRRPTDTREKALEQLIVRHLAGISEHPNVRCFSRKLSVFWILT